MYFSFLFETFDDKADFTSLEVQKLFPDDIPFIFKAYDFVILFF